MAVQSLKFFERFNRCERIGQFVRRSSQTFSRGVQHSRERQYYPHRSPRHEAVAGRGRLDNHPGGAEFSLRARRNAPFFHRHGNQALLGFHPPFLNRLLDIQALSNADTYSSPSVADHHRRPKTKTLTPGGHAGNAPQVQHFFLKLIRFFDG